MGVADFNRDENLDVANGGYNQATNWLRQGDGTFGVLAKGLLPGPISIASTLRIWIMTVATTS